MHLVIGFPGFLFFIGGAQLEFSTEEHANSVARAMVNAVLAMAGAGIFDIIFDRLTGSGFRLTALVSAQLAGLVAVCAGANVFEGWAAFLVGMIAAASQLMWAKLLVRLRVDDAVDAVSVHLGAGIWGIIARPLLERQTGVMYIAVGARLPGLLLP